MKTDVKEINADLLRDLTLVRGAVMSSGDAAAIEAFAGVETFCAIAVRVFAKTNPSKLRSEAMTVEIAYHVREVENERRALPQPEVQDSTFGEFEEVSRGGQ